MQKSLNSRRKSGSRLNYSTILIYCPLIHRKTFEDFKAALDEDKPKLMHVPEIIAVDDESFYLETEVPPLPVC